MRNIGQWVPWESVLHNSFFYGKSGMLLVYLGLILLTKVFATVATNIGGGCGGIFAPSLFLGCITGFVFSHICNLLHVGGYMPEQNFALFGMAGLMSGVMHAPLTGIFLIAELTGGYGLFLPLMIVSAVSYLTIRIFQPHSIYSMRLARKGELITHHKDRSVLTLMKTENVIENDFLTVSPDMDLGKLTGIVSRSSRNLFPVLLEMMRHEGVEKEGHLQINKNVIIQLNDLHARLMHSTKFPYYQAAYYKVLPAIVELRAKSGTQDETEIENCFDALYGVWMLKLQHKPLSKETLGAMQDISTFLGMLSDYYQKDNAGELKFE